MRAPSWGIEPVPERLRVLGTLDTFLLWTNLGISLLVLVLPAYFDLSLRDALAATLVGGVIGNGMLALAALIGADAPVPRVGDLRADRDRHRGGSVVRQVVRLRGDLALEARVRRRRDAARAARPDRLRP